MIELDVVSYLIADSELDTLLGATGADSKIYAIQKPLKSSMPYIIYNNPAEGSVVENLEDVTISFNCVDTNYIIVRNIMVRLDELLNKESDITTLISSSSYYIYWCKRTGGSTFVDPESKQKDLFHRVSVYDFKYNLFT